MIAITGASDGLGLELAKLYKKAGKEVVNVSRSGCKVADYNIACDLSNTNAIQTAVSEIINLNKPLELLINNAGVHSEQPIGEITTDQIDKLMAINVRATIMITSGLAEKIKSDEADVLIVVSTAATKGNPAHATYAASKWAQLGYGKSLQNELKKTRSRVINFCPGGMKTKFFEKDSGNDSTEDGDYWMDPADIAKLIKQLVDLPKGIEVSDIIVNRKTLI